MVKIYEEQSLAHLNYRSIFLFEVLFRLYFQAFKRLSYYTDFNEKKGRVRIELFDFRLRQDKESHDRENGPKGKLNRFNIECETLLSSFIIIIRNSKELHGTFEL